MSYDSAISKRRFLDDCLKKGQVRIVFQPKLASVPDGWDHETSIEIDWKLGLPLEVSPVGVAVTVPLDVAPVTLFLPWKSIASIVSMTDGTARNWT